VCAVAFDVLTVRTRRAPCGSGIHYKAAPRESQSSRSDPPCPSKSAWRQLKRLVPCRLNFVTKNPTSTVSSSFTPFSAAFTLKLRESKQSSDRRRGGLQLRGIAPTGSWFLPLCGHPPRKQTLARALRVVCLERLRASKEIFPCMYMLSGMASGRSLPADVSEIRAWFVDTNPTGELISVHHHSPNALADPRKPLACSRHYA
jgi:hypothetical protein